MIPVPQYLAIPGSRLPRCDGLPDVPYEDKLDRLTRLGVADVFETVKLLRAAGCALHCVADGLSIVPEDTGTLKAAMTDGLVAMLAVAAQIEGLSRRERTADKRAAMKARGVAWGRPPDFTPEQAAQVRRLASEGVSVRETAQRVGLKKSTVQRLRVHHTPAEIVNAMALVRGQGNRM